MKSASRYLLLFIILSISYLELHGQPIDENKLFKDPCNYCQTNSFRKYFSNNTIIKDFYRDTSFNNILFYIISFKNNNIDSVSMIEQIDTITPMRYIIEKSSKYWNYEYINNSTLILEVNILVLGSDYYYDKKKPYPKLSIDREKYVKEIFKKFPNCVFLPPFEYESKFSCILTKLISIDTISVPLKK